MQGLILRNKKILISGQVLNSLTEMVEDYLKDKVNILCVIGISSPYSTAGFARMTNYQKGELKFNKKIFNPFFNRPGRRSFYVWLFVFSIYFYSILKAAFRFKERFDIFVGVSCFSTFVGIILKSLKVVNKVIYYSIDYFPLQHGNLSEYIMGKAFFILDRFCACFSDLVWHINPDITEARYVFGGLDPSKYRSINVPLGYDEELSCPKTCLEIERYTLGFVGTLSPNQGLQMAIKAFTKIVGRYPQAKFEIIGDGIFGQEIRKMVKESPVKEHIILHGFIGDRKRVSQILSHCTLGIAPWTMDVENNIKYADPGKPKHYAFCGLPIIITRSNRIAFEIEQMKAGIAINYDEAEFVEAITMLFEQDEILQEYKRNALKFAQKYISSNIFRDAWEKSLKLL